MAAQPRYQPLVTVLAAVAAGIIFDRYIFKFIGQPVLPLVESREPIALWCLAACCLVGWWYLWQSRRDALAALSLLAAAALTGAAWHNLQWRLFDGYEIARYAVYEPAPACIEAIVRQSPERVPAPQPTPLRAIPGSEGSRFRITASRIRDGVNWRPASGECQLFVEGHLLGIHPGDRLRVFGQLGRVNPPLNPGEFDFASHARADRQLVRMRTSGPDSVLLTASAHGRRPANMLDSFRGRAKRLVRNFVGPERAGLAAAILLGAREGLTADQTEPYLLTGTIHVLVVSGMNVAILATGLYAMMRVGWLPRRMGLAVVMVVAVGYALLAEAQPPVMRAAVFAVLLCIATWTGRRGVAFNSLAGAALVVLAINPAELFRAGPQLSFLAVAALIWIGTWSQSRKIATADRLDQLLAAARPGYWRAFAAVSRWTGWLLITSLVVWLATLPLVLQRFHVASPVAVLISPAIWAVVFVAMWSGFVMLIFGWMIPPLGSWSGWVCGTSLSALDHVVEWAESLPGGHFWAPGPAWWWVCAFYLGLIAVMIRGRAIVPPRWQLAALCAWVLVGLVPPLARTWQRDGLECSFVAVGHGACVVLQTPTGETLLYDAGSLGSPESATHSIASYLWHRGIMRIDGIVISHADVDHYNAVPGCNSWARS